MTAKITGKEMFGKFKIENKILKLTVRTFIELV